jgi:hypothetical protein
MKSNTRLFALVVGFLLGWASCFMEGVMGSKQISPGAAARRWIAYRLYTLAGKVYRPGEFVGGSVSIYLLENVGIQVDDEGRLGTPIWEQRGLHDGTIYTKADFEDSRTKPQIRPI